MFVRAKKSGAYQYLQLVHNQRVDGKVRQQVVATLGRLDLLQQSGQIDALIASCGRFAQHTAVLDAHRQGRTQAVATIKIGPVLVFERLWKELGLPEILGDLLRDRRFEFAVERVVFLTVLHRLFDPGSDRAAEVWHRAYAIEGTGELELQHFYRTMGWLGEPLPLNQQAGATPFGLRCLKDLIEEALFARRRNLFSSLDLVFFDTTSIYFEGQGGESIGQYGHSKDHRPDCRQMVVGAVLDNTGRPICCELWPGNTTDAKTLIPIVDRLRERFCITQVCIVADRGMISKKTIAELQAGHRDVRFILGARLRAVKEIREKVLADPGAYQQVHGPKTHSKDPSPLSVKEVRVDDRRYAVCYNEDQARKDRADREAIVGALRDQLKRGDKSLIGNKGYRKFLKRTEGKHFEIDQDKVQQEARFDGIWVLQTDAPVTGVEAALRYKELWMVESVFRCLKSVLETRPIYHKCDDTIRGHVFCSFLALVLLNELQVRLEARGWYCEWERLKNDLDALEEITVANAGKNFVIRSPARGDASKALQAVGVALGSAIRLSE
ncbi:MAG TPA: IS1634 family transposase [Anaerolineales bacterium]|nr:IS1634 family transposase [Anaerolineales bacterium]